MIASTAEPAVSQQQPLIDNVFIQSDLQAALEDIAVQANVNILTDSSVRGLVTVTLDEVTFDEALRLVLAGTEYLVHRADDYFLVYSPDATNDVFSRLSETRLVDLQHLTAESAQSLISQPLQRYVRIDGQAGKLAVTAPPSLLERIIADIRALDRPGTDETVFMALVHVDAENARTLLPKNLQRHVRVDQRRNMLAITAPGATRGRIVAQLRRLDVPLPADATDVPNVHRTTIVKLKHTKAEAALNLLPAALDAFVRSDAESNTLAISAPDNLLDGIKQDIANIDVPREHIMLDARVVVLSRRDLLDFGTDFEWPQVQAGGFTGQGLGFPWGLRIGYTPNREFTNALTLSLNLLSQNDEATIIASPQVLAQDGREAEIRVTTEEYFQITAESGAFVRSELEVIETGTILGITPQVSPTGQLTLDMNIEVSDVVARGRDNLPVVSRRTARSTVQIENGGTAAVAGLVDTSAQFRRTGTPGSASVPLLGQAFRTDSLDHQTRQVAVFVTATLVDDDVSEFPSQNADKHPVCIIDEVTYRNELELTLDQMGIGS